MLTPSVKCDTLTLKLDEGEFINGVKVFSANLVDRIEFKTNLGNKFEAGSRPKEEHLVEEADMRENHRLIGIKCGLGGHIHNLQFQFI
mmetsp:Transcript_7010/g.11774  ORF Transcript_7010/g.11774 Transcript_7010/m.11774 type:complete len:88 (+) Transcript_7010:256-519(+)